jgi:hypothetical protein
MLHRSGNLTGGATSKSDRSGKLRAASEKSASKQAISEKEYQKLSERCDALIKQLIEVEGEQISEHRFQDEQASIVTKVSQRRTLLRNLSHSAVQSLSPDCFSSFCLSDHRP